MLVVLVGLERLAELVVSKRNAAWSKEQGGVETGFSHYPFMVVLHTGLLVGALVEAYVREPVVPAWLAWSMLVVVLLTQALRWWCIATLGRRWNTRVIIVPGMPPVHRPVPTAIISHPNYVAVVVEGIALPLVHAAWITAVVFTVLNAVLLTVRIRVENAALATLPQGAGRCLTGCPTSSSRAVAPSAWPPRCTPPAPASRSWSASRGPGRSTRPAARG